MYYVVASKLNTDNGHTVTDEETMAKKFDNCFVNFGKTMADVIAPSSTYNLNFTAANRGKKRNDKISVQQTEVKNKVKKKLAFFTPSCQ